MFSMFTIQNLQFPHRNKKNSRALKPCCKIRLFSCNVYVNSSLKEHLKSIIKDAYLFDILPYNLLVVFA